MAITGLGVVTPFGAGTAGWFSALSCGETALKRHTGLCSKRPGPFEGLPLWSCVVPDFGAEQAIEAGKRRRMPRLCQMALVAAREALGLEPGADAGEAAIKKRYPSERIAVVLGTSLGTVECTMDFVDHFVRHGLAQASPAQFPYTVMNASAALVAMELGLRGPNVTTNHRELSFPEALLSGAELLCTGRADAVVCGGCDELGPWLSHALAALSAISPAATSAEAAPLCPYENRGLGLCPGEGAVVCVLERADGATSAEPWALLRGWARSGDVRPRIGWPKDATDEQVWAQAGAAVARSLAAAGVQPGALDYVVGAGDGTAFDRLETVALRAGLGTHAESVHISSVLGQCGQSGISPGLRLAAALWSLRQGRLCGTTGCVTPDSACSLPGLGLKPTDFPVKNVLLPTFAQGGGNVCLVLGA